MEKTKNESEILLSAPEIIGKGMLVTAGNTADGFNCMTATWGGIGFLWKKNVFTFFIRPQRYTLGFAEKNELITACFFDDSEKSKKILAYCGSHSGRDADKAKECSLTPISVSDGKAVVFAEAEYSLVCRKLYVTDIKAEDFADKTLLGNYEKGDFHRVFVCEIKDVAAKRTDSL